MSALDFERFQLGRWFDQLKDNPEQLLLGAATPFGAQMWGGLLGKDYEPLVNMWGGPTDATWQAAEAEGVDSGDARNAHAIAQGISQFYAGNYFGGDPSGLLGGQPQTPDNTSTLLAMQQEKRKREAAKNRPKLTGGGLI